MLIVIGTFELISFIFHLRRGNHCLRQCEVSRETLMGKRRKKGEA
jgi:hypothetical protein